MPNLNSEAHFAQSPLGVDIPRSTFDRSCSWKGSYNAGKLNCMFVDEILPGDTVDMKVSRLDRMTTPLYPVMDDCFIDQYFFFVPNRLVWEHWKEFNGENNVSSWIQPIDYQIPTIDIAGSNSTERSVGDLLHQMGLTPQFAGGSRSYTEINALPLRAYALIWNEWFRDQNLQDPILINTGDEEDNTDLFKLLPVNRIHDRFGSCLKSPLKGETVKIALQGFAPVVTRDAVASKAGDPALQWSNRTTGALESGNGNILVRSGATGIFAQASVSATNDIIPRNQFADGSTLFTDVAALRLAVQTTRVLEKLSIGGSRYVEFVRSMFGIVSPDARQQRPELLGHRRVHVRMNEVTQNSPTLSNTTPLGTIGASSKTVDNGLAFTHSFTEHGYLFGLFCVRHNRTYSQGIPKMFTRKVFGDFYLPAFAHLSEMPVYTYEIYADPDTVEDDDIFGYAEAWSEYRFKPSINTGLLDPGVEGTLGDVWTYGDDYSSAPILSDDWIKEGSSEIQRTLAVQDEDQFIGDVFFDFKHTRCMPVYSIPGLVDHF